jgi:hypothetical protein
MAALDHRPRFMDGHELPAGPEKHFHGDSLRCADAEHLFHHREGGLDAHSHAGLGWTDGIDAHHGTVALVTGIDWVQAVITGSLPPLMDEVHHGSDAWQVAAPVAPMPETAHTSIEEIHRVL